MFWWLVETVKLWLNVIWAHKDLYLKGFMFIKLRIIPKLRTLKKMGLNWEKMTKIVDNKLTREQITI